MKNLKDIYESLLDDDDELFDQFNMVDVITKYVSENFTVSNGYKLSFTVVEVGNGNYEVRTRHNVKTTEKCPAITNGCFKWGDMKKQKFDIISPNITNLEGMPDVLETLNIYGGNINSFKGMPKIIKQLTIYNADELVHADAEGSTIETVWFHNMKKVQTISGIKVNHNLILEHCPALKSLSGFTFAANVGIIVSESSITNLKGLEGKFTKIRIVDSPIESLEGLNAEVERLAIGDGNKLKNMTKVGSRTNIKTVYFHDIHELRVDFDKLFKYDNLEIRCDNEGLVQDIQDWLAAHPEQKLYKNTYICYTNKRKEKIWYPESPY